jgi:hypothetical protein
MDAPSQRENFNHPSTICRTYGAGRHTLSIPRIALKRYFVQNLSLTPEKKATHFTGQAQKLDKRGCFSTVSNEKAPGKIPKGL